MKTAVSVKRKLRLNLLDEIPGVSVSLGPRYLVPFRLVVVAGGGKANGFAGF